MPEELVSLLALGPENFQGQHDAPFWFMLSPGEVSRELNGIVKLGLIDSTLSNLAGELRKARARIEVTEERLKEASERTSRLSWAREADGDLKKVEKAGESLEGERDRAANLERMLGELGEASLASRQALAALPPAQRMEEAWERMQETKGKVNRLVILLNELEESRLFKVKARTDGSIVEQELTEAMKDGCPLCGK